MIVTTPRPPMSRTSGFAVLLVTALAALSSAQPSWQDSVGSNAPSRAQSGWQAPAGSSALASAECPASLSRPAGGLSGGEAIYATLRKNRAGVNLRNWLKTVDPKLDAASMPTIALTTSGGGYRSMLTGAGVVQAMDAAESSEPTKGLYQSLTYHTGLSGGAWLLSALTGNSPNVTISQIKRDLWDPKLGKNSLYPINTFFAPERNDIYKDLIAKAAAGFTPTITDVWSRFLSFQLLEGGMNTRFSEVFKRDNVLATDRPYPIITTIAKTGGIGGSKCEGGDDAPQFEFTPHEAGSWDRGIAAFTPTRLLGSSPANASQCRSDFDNLPYILGSSSNMFYDSCGWASISAVAAALKPLLPAATPGALGGTGVDAQRRLLYAPFPNPFYGSDASPLVKQDKELYLLDGGSTNQNNPIWPLLQPIRGVDVILVNDNSADTPNAYPNGTELFQVYNQARLQGLTRMPVIPSVATFMSRGLDKRAAFFGCRDPQKVTLVFLPNAKFTTESGIPTSTFQFTPAESEALIRNGRAIMGQGGAEGWTKCLACAIVHKKMEPQVAAECDACLNKYCA